MLLRSNRIATPTTAKLDENQKPNHCSFVFPVSIENHHIFINISSFQIHCDLGPCSCLSVLLLQPSLPLLSPLAFYSKTRVVLAINALVQPKMLGSFETSQRDLFTHLQQDFSSWRRKEVNNNHKKQNNTKTTHDHKNNYYFRFGNRTLGLCPNSLILE